MQPKESNKISGQLSNMKVGEQIVVGAISKRLSNGVVYTVGDELELRTNNKVSDFVVTDIFGDNIVISLKNRHQKISDSDRVRVLTRISNLRS